MRKTKRVRQQRRYLAQLHTKKKKKPQMHKHTKLNDVAQACKKKTIIRKKTLSL